MDELAYNTEGYRNILGRVIELVKNYPIIWMEDRSVGYIRNQDLRRKAYDSISKDMPYFSGDRVRRTWTRLRCKYKTELRLELKNGNISTWCHFADMDFMRDIVLDTAKDIDFDFSNAEFLNEPLDTNTPQEFADEFQDIQQPSATINEAIGGSTNASEFQTTTLSNQRANQKGNTNIAAIQDISDLQPETVQEPPPVTSSSSNTTNLREFRKSKRSRINMETLLAVFTSSDIPYISGPTNPKNLESDQLKLQTKTKTSPLPCAIKPLKKKNSTEDIIDLTDTFEIKPTQVVKAMPTAPPSPLKTAKPAENFQESHVSTSGSAKRSLDAIADSAVSPPQKRINSTENPSQAESKDEDYYFVMSLLPSLKKIAEDKKIDLRINILKLISKDLDKS